MSTFFLFLFYKQFLTTNCKFDPHYTPNFTLILIRFLKYRTPFTILIFAKLWTNFIFIQLITFGSIKHHLCNHLASTTNCQFWHTFRDSLYLVKLVYTFVRSIHLGKSYTPFNHVYLVLPHFNLCD